MAGIHAPLLALLLVACAEAGADPPAPPTAGACRLLFGPSLATFTRANGACPDIRPVTAEVLFGDLCVQTDVSRCEQGYRCDMAVGPLTLWIDLAWEHTPVVGVAAFEASEVGCAATYTVAFN